MGEWVCMGVVVGLCVMETVMFVFFIDITCISEQLRTLSYLLLISLVSQCIILYLCLLCTFKTSKSITIPSISTSKSIPNGPTRIGPYAWNGGLQYATEVLRLHAMVEIVSAHEFRHV